ncbi:MAG TPA: SRPBCC family protein [Actinomycetota bacterium]|jgi:carbon monoxide dehydrogenase subunit G
MSVVEVSEVIDARPEAVWDVVANPENLPVWDRHIYEVEGVPKTGLERGTEYTTGVKFMGARAHASARVLEIEPERYSKIELRGLVEGIVETWLEPLDGGRTRLRHRVAYRFKGGPIGELAARAIQMLGATALLRKGIQAQKRQAENSGR